MLDYFSMGFDVGSSINLRDGKEISLTTKFFEQKNIIFHMT